MKIFPWLVLLLAISITAVNGCWTRRTNERTTSRPKEGPKSGSRSGTKSPGGTQHHKDAGEDEYDTTDDHDSTHSKGGLRKVAGAAGDTNSEKGSTSRFQLPSYIKINGGTHRHKVAGEDHYTTVDHNAKRKRETFFFHRNINSEKIRASFMNFCAQDPQMTSLALWGACAQKGFGLSVELRKSWRTGFVNIFYAFLLAFQFNK